MPIHIFNTFDDPLANAGTTEAFGVNDTDQIVGFFQNATGFHGFLESGGTFITLDDPLAFTGTTAANGINGSGQTRHCRPRRCCPRSLDNEGFGDNCISGLTRSFGTCCHTLHA